MGNYHSRDPKPQTLSLALLIVGFHACEIANLHFRTEIANLYFANRIFCPIRLCLGFFSSSVQRDRWLVPGMAPRARFREDAWGCPSVCPALSCLALLWFLMPVISLCLALRCLAWVCLAWPWFDLVGLLLPWLALASFDLLWLSLACLGLL